MKVEFLKGINKNSILAFLIPKTTLLTSIEEFFVRPFFSRVSLERGDESTVIRFYNFFEVTIECIEIIILKPISIRGIRDYSRRRITRKEWRKFLGILARKVDIAWYSCSLCISLGDFYHQRIDIGSIYLILSAWIGFHAGDIFHARKLISHMKGEWLNTEMSIHSWGDIAGEHRCFYGDRPWSAKWIKEWFPIFPVRESNKCACEIFFYGSLSRFLSIPSLMERITGDI